MMCYSGNIQYHLNTLLQNFEARHFLMLEQCGHLHNNESMICMNTISKTTVKGK